MSLSRGRWVGRTDTLGKRPAERMKRRIGLLPDAPSMLITPTRRPQSSLPAGVLPRPLAGAVRSCRY